MRATIDSTTTRSALPVGLRAVERADIADVAGLVYEAFATIHDHYSFQRDFPSLAVAEQMTSAFVAHPSIWGVVAECDGQIVGSNFLDERGPIRGLGPITVHPAAQSRGVGRRLMQAALERARDAGGVRLFQDSFNVASLSLYASLGFEVKEPAVVLSGRPRSGRRPQWRCARSRRPTSCDVRSSVSAPTALSAHTNCAMRSRPTPSRRSWPSATVA